MKTHAAEKAADILRALANPSRLRIAALLCSREMCVCEITEALNEKESLVSQNLNKMKDKGILISRRSGNKVIYSLKDSVMMSNFLDCVVHGQDI